MNRRVSGQPSVIFSRVSWLFICANLLNLRQRGWIMNPQTKKVVTFAFIAMLITSAAVGLALVIFLLGGHPDLLKQWLGSLSM